MTEAKFSNRLFLCMALAVGGLVGELYLAPLPVMLAANLTCLGILTVSASRRVKARSDDFDHVVAAESIVAFGVFALVLGLSFILFKFLFRALNFEAIAEGDLTSFLPFAEGLLTAGFAPLCAIWVRTKAAETGTPDGIDDIDGLATATAALVTQMVAARSAVESFAAGAAKAGTSTHGLADTMRTEADRWALALAEGQANVKTLGEAARTGGSELSSLATEAARLKAVTAETATMLEELGRLIDAIERFVEPRARPGR